MKPVRPPLMPLDEAWTRLAEAVRAHLSRPEQTPAIEDVASETALGRVLAADLVSTVDVPPADNSAMDGYAVRVADLRAGTVLPVQQRVAAGQVGEALAPGHCARIFTGAPIPPGADAVVMQEQVQVSDGGVQFTTDVSVGQNVRRRGEDIAVGQTVLQAGTRLTPAALGVAASVGAASLAVYRRVRVGLLSTGDELVMPGQPLPPGAIYNSNRHTLLGLLQAVGAEGRDLGVLPDRLDATRAALREAAAQHDVIVSSGGVSVGEEDHLRQALLAEGGLDFWALAIKPGKPFVFGWINRPDGSRALYLGLPGNPVASFVTFLLLVRPVLGLLGGEGWHLPQGWSTSAGFDWPKPDKRREFLRARLGPDGAVQLYAHQGSGVLSSAAWADGLVDVAPGQVVQRGDRVAFYPLSELLQPAASCRQPGACA